MKTAFLYKLAQASSQGRGAGVVLVEVHALDE